MGSLQGADAMPSGVHVVLWQLFKDGPTWDGNIACKTSRKWLVENDFAFHAPGWTSLTTWGVEMAVSLGMGDAKDAGRDFLAK